MSADTSISEGLVETGVSSEGVLIAGDSSRLPAGPVRYTICGTSNSIALSAISVFDHSTNGAFDSITTSGFFPTSLKF